MTTSSTLGMITSPVEVQQISSHGIWILVEEKEYFLPNNEFPWFKDATVGDICEVDLLHGNHLYWPKLDIDLALDSLDHLEQYPLIAKC